MNIDDIYLIIGEIIIRQGKGRKPRDVYIGNISRKAVRSYLKYRNDNNKALCVRDDGEGRLNYDGLQAMIIRRVKINQNKRALAT